MKIQDWLLVFRGADDRDRLGQHALERRLNVLIDTGQKRCLCWMRLHVQRQHITRSINSRQRDNWDGQHDGIERTWIQPSCVTSYLSWIENNSSSWLSSMNESGLPVCCGRIKCVTRNSPWLCQRKTTIMKIKEELKFAWRAVVLLVFQKWSLQSRSLCWC